MQFISLSNYKIEYFILYQNTIIVHILPKNFHVTITLYLNKSCIIIFKLFDSIQNYQTYYF